MKKIKILLILPVLSCSYVNAQVVDSCLISKGGRLFMGDTRLTREAIANLDGFDMQLYKSGRAKFTSGVVLTSVGAIPTAIATSAMVETIIDAKTRNPQIPPSGLGPTLMIVFGVPALILEGIGIPLTCVGLKDIRTSVSNYNGSRPVQLSLQPSMDCIYMGNSPQSALGFSLAFRF